MRGIYGQPEEEDVNEMEALIKARFDRVRSLLFLSPSDLSVFSPDR
jgi:hypothetical protein